MVKCPSHDENRKRKCIGEGCRVFDLKQQIAGVFGARALRVIPAHDVGLWGRSVRIIS